MGCSLTPRFLETLCLSKAPLLATRESEQGSVCKKRNQGKLSKVSNGAVQLIWLELILALKFYALNG